MGYTRALANDFWYEFDNYFAWEFDKHPESDLAFKKLGDLLTPFITYRQKKTFPQDFVKEIEQDSARVDAIKVLAKAQLDIFCKFFCYDLLSQQRAFEDFGQGVLFDNRAPRFTSASIHMMDEGIRGYFRWHVFIRALVLINQKDTRQHDTWLQIDRHVGLASAIHRLQQPRQSDENGSNPNNREIDYTSLNKLRTIWLVMNFQQLDTAFDQYIGLIEIEPHTLAISNLKTSTHELTSSTS